MLSQDFKEFVELLIQHQNKIANEIDDLVINFIGYHDLIQNKLSTGRLKDLGDIEHLQ